MKGDRVARLGNPFSYVKELVESEQDAGSRHVPAIVRWLRQARRHAHNAELLLLDSRSPDTARFVTSDALGAIENHMRVLVALHGEAEAARLLRKHLQTEVGRVRDHG